MSARLSSTENLQAAHHQHIRIGKTKEGRAAFRARQKAGSW